MSLQSIFNQIILNPIAKYIALNSKQSVLNFWLSGYEKQLCWNILSLKNIYIIYYMSYNLYCNVLLCERLLICVKGSRFGVYRCYNHFWYLIGFRRDHFDRIEYPATLTSIEETGVYVKRVRRTSSMVG